MKDASARRRRDLAERMAAEGIDLAFLTEPDSIFYFAHLWGYLGVENNRPMLLAVPRAGDPVLICPAIELAMARRMTNVADIRTWVDGVDGEWPALLEKLLAVERPRTVGVETARMPGLVARPIRDAVPRARLVDLAPILGVMRMIKDEEEIQAFRDGGRIAMAMARAAEAKVAPGVPEYEMTLAAVEAGTREAAELLARDGPDSLHTPHCGGLPIVQSGQDMCLANRRVTGRVLRHGDPILYCFCEMATFKNYRTAFDRAVFVGDATDEQARIYEAAIAAQKAAMEAIRPGVPAEEPHLAAEAVYRAAGFGASYRIGRGIGCSLVESPELKRGERMPLRAGMVLGIDGGILVPEMDFAARIGDTVLVTEDGIEDLTPYPRELRTL
jgi:Xaa-Pro dipeptidase